MSHSIISMRLSIYRVKLIGNKLIVHKTQIIRINRFICHAKIKMVNSLNEWARTAPAV